METKPTYKELEKKLHLVKKELDEYKFNSGKLKEIEWLLKPKDKNQHKKVQSYGDLTDFNKNGIIKNSIGKRELHEIVEDFMSLLGTSCAIYEKNGDYAYGILTSGWCRTLDEASFKLCKTNDIQKALHSEKWLCHKSCWNEASKLAIYTNEATDTACSGGIRLYAVPIETSSGVIGSINFGYSTPPKDEKSLINIANKHEIPLDSLKKLSNGYKTRPEFIIEIAKERIKKSAKLIAQMVEKKQANKAVKKSEEKFRHAFNHSGIGMALVNPEGQFVEVNGMVTKIFGYSHEEFATKSYMEITHPEEVERSMEKYQGLLDGKYNSYEIEKRYLTKNGKTIWGHLNISLIRDQENNPLYSIAQLQDITKKKEAEEAIYKSKEKAEENEKKYLNIAEYTFDWETYYDNTGNIAFVNSAFEKITGFSSDDFKSKKIRIEDIVHKEDLTKTQKIFEKAFSGEIIDSYVFKLINKNKKTVYVEMCSQGVFSSNNQLMGVRTSIRDITERTNIEYKLRETYQFNKKIIDESPVGIWIYKENGETVLINKAGVELAGDDAALLLSFNFRELESWKKSGMYDAAIEALDKNKLVKKEVHVINTLGVDVWFDAIFFPIQLSGEKHLLLLTNDIKERKQAEIEKSRLFKNLDSLWNLAKNEYESINLLTEHVLNEINALTGSKFSFYGFLNEDESTMRIYSWNKEAMNECKIIDKPIDYVIDKAGIWAEAVRTRKAIVVNNYAGKNKGKLGLPKGHVNLTRLVSIPIIRKGKIVALAAVANKVTDYTDEDIKSLESFLYNAQILADQKISEEKRKIESFFLKKAQEIGTIGTWKLDIRANVLEWTEENYKIFGLPLNTELNYERFLECVHPDDRDFVNKEWTNGINGNSYDIEHRLLVNGKVKWVREKADFEFDENGQITGAIGVTQDITYQKQFEQQLKESYNLLNNLAEQVPGVIYQYRLYPDGSSAFPYSSSGMYDIYEVTPEEVREDASPVFTRIHPDDYDHIVETITKSAQNQTLYTSEFRVILPKQGLRWRHCDAKPELLEDGSTLWHGIITDITDRKNSEEKLHEQQLLFETMFNTIAEGVIITNTKREILHANKGMLTTFGYKPEDIIGKSTQLLYSAQTTFNQAGKNVFDKGAKGSETNYLTYYRHKNNSVFPGETFGTKLYNTNGEWIGNLGIMRNVSERIKFIDDLKKAKEKAEESEQQFRSLFENMNSAYAYCKIILKDNEPVDFLYLDANKAFEKMTGLKNVIGKTETELVPGIRKSDPEMFKIVGRVAMTGEPVRLEYYVKAMDKWFDSSIYSPKKGYYVSINDDITKKKQVEIQLKNAKKTAEISEDRLNKMFNNMNAGVAIYQAINNGNDFLFIDFNEAAERITGDTKKNVVGKSLLERFPNMQKAPLFKALQQVYITEKDIELPPFYYKDGKRDGWRENYIYKLPTGEIVAIFEDVTKREEYQQALLESEKKFRTIYEMAEDLICIADLNSIKYLDINPSFSRVLGYSNKEILDRTFLDFVHPDDVQKTIDAIKDEVQEGKSLINFVNRYKCKDGSYRWFDWNTHVIENKNMSYAIAHDITDIRNYQTELEKHKNNLEQLVKERTQQLEKTLKELKEAETHLIQSEKMASLGILTAGVAHEINNPLNYIQSSIYGLESMKKKGFNKETLERIIRNMKEGVLRASNIVKSLNTFSRKGRGKTILCDINEIIERCLLILNHELKKNGKVTKRFTNDSFIFMANEEGLLQVFINLIMNSIQALKSNGKITISTELVTEKEQLKIKITDNGEGISQENLSKIFDPFFTTKDPGKGVGIGLSIVYKIVTDHNGTINYKSQLSKGTEVTINFPVKLVN